MTQKLIITIVLVCAVIAIQSCSSSTKSNPEDQLKERIDLLMTSRLNDNWNEVYNFFDTNYRNNLSREDFMKLSRIKYLSYQIETVKIDASEKKADADVKYSVLLNNGIEVKDLTEKQHWILENNNWYLVSTPGSSIVD